MQKKAKHVYESKTTQIQILMPRHINGYNRLFGGQLVEWIDVVAAVVYVGFPGEKGGEAIANVLTGKANPSGTLTETFPLAYEDTPAAQAYADSKVTRYEEGMDVGYRYFDTYGKPVLFPFGHGLS